MAERCPWKINWSVASGQCRKDDHLTGRRVPTADGDAIAAEPDPEHEILLDNGVTVIHWLTGDRREFTGDWPGACPMTAPWPDGQCTLPAGHHGRCAP